jgi:hypothetical protein
MGDRPTELGPMTMEVGPMLMGVGPRSVGRKTVWRNKVRRSKGWRMSD